MSPNIDNGPAEVPLVEQLLSVPRTCHEMIEVGECAHRNIPYGEFCHMAAEEINNLVRIHAFNAGAFQAREAEIASLRLALAASRDEAEKAKAQLSSKRAEVRFQKNLVATADSVIHDMIPDSLDAGAAESAAHTIIDLRAKLAALAKECESLRADKERMDVILSREHWPLPNDNRGMVGRPYITYTSYASEDGAFQRGGEIHTREELDRAIKQARADAARKEPPAKAHGCEVGE